MRALKLALLAELELGCIWTLILVAASTTDVGLASFMMFVWIYPLQLLCMVGGAIFFWRRPETRTLATAVMTVPVALLFLPMLIRVVAGGPVAAHPAAWLMLIGLPLGACLLLPHHVVDFLPQWTLKSRWLNVSTVVMLAMFIVPWLGLLLVGPVSAQAAGPRRTDDLRGAVLDETLAGPMLAVLLFAALTTVIAAITLLTSYVGLFQRVDRRQQKLHIAKLVLSIVLLAPSVLILAVGLVLAAVAMAPLG